MEALGNGVVWKRPVYNTIWHMVRNPMYASAYAFGKTESRTKVIDGRARKSEGHFKPVDTWMVLIRNHHSGYIAWELPYQYPWEVNDKLSIDPYSV